MARRGSHLYTIGHSNHPIERFLELLRQHDIQTLADVRSIPFSRFNPQFNKARLEASLREAGVDYALMGEELGARSKDPACYEDGRVSYAKLAASSAFKRGLERLQSLMRERRTAVMCAEREPLDCHRTILVGREIERAGGKVVHILADGTLEMNEHALERLAEELDIPREDLFRNSNELADAAYDVQAARIAYAKPPPQR